MSTLFTKIIQGELPGRFIYRSDDVVAFLTIEPVAYGHTLVVPTAEVDRWTDLDPQVWMRVNEVAQQIGTAMIEAFGAPRAGYIIAGFDVPHTHVHVFPATSIHDYNFANAMPMDTTDPALMDAAAAKLRAVLGTSETGEVSS